MKLIYIFLFVIILSSLEASIRPVTFKKSKVGCFSLYGKFSRMECLEQQISFKILNKLWYSRRKKTKLKLRKKIVERAQYFLKKKAFDYQSVISFMIFPLKDRLSWIEKFKKISTMRAPFEEVALARITRNTKQLKKYCDKENTDYFLKEICEIKIRSGRRF